MSKDVTFDERRSFFNPTYLQGENIQRDDKYKELGLLISLPLFEKLDKTPQAAPPDEPDTIQHVPVELAPAENEPNPNLKIILV